MKKLLFSIAALMMGCALLSAQEVNIDGVFRRINKNALPTLWSKNGPGMKDASISVVKAKDGNILKIATKGKYAAFYSAGTFNAVPGTNYKVTAMIKGTAADFTIGYYGYGEKNAFLANAGLTFAVNSPEKFTKYEGTFTLVKNPKLKKIRIQFGSGKPYNVEIKSIRVEAVPAAAAK